MRNVGLQWRNLADGLSRVEALEARFRGHWAPRLEKARRARYEADLRRARRRGRAALVTALVLTLVFIITALALHLISSPAIGAFLVLAIMTPVVFVLYALWSLLRTPELRGQRRDDPIRGDANGLGGLSQDVNLCTSP